MPEIGPDTRDENLGRMEREEFDVVVIGGGITGAGVALDAASRGMKVALVEKADFASGTSSKSSKMVHGGLRYLAQYQFGLTWEASRERDLLRRLAPHLVRPLEFLFPAYRKGIQTRFATIGLTLYDIVAGGRGFARHRRAGPDVVRRIAPTLDPSRVVGAWTYWDARADDARFVFEILRTAHRFGASAVNHARVVGLDASGDRLVAANVVDAVTGREIAVRGKTFVNAGGVWAHEISTLEPPATAPELRPAKGIHLVVPRATVPVTAGVVLPSVMKDGRSIFAVPGWGDTVVLGTTDTEYSGSLDSPAVAEEDVSYVLKSANWSLGVAVRPQDIVAAWAGLRPLRAGAGGLETPTADLSRKHHLSVSRAGLVTITGGKLTTYRRMAADTVDLVCSRLGRGGGTRTKRIPIGLGGSLAGLESEVSEAAGRLGLDPDLAAHLARFGDRAFGVMELAAHSPALARPLCSGLPWIGAEAVWAMRHEMAVSLGDVLERRTRLSLADRRAGLDSEAPALVARERSWTPEALAAEVAALEARVAGERGPVASPAASSHSRGSVADPL